MKGLILAGGAGTRLRPITHTSAKQLVPIANKPIIFYGIEHMAGGRDQADRHRRRRRRARPRSARPSATVRRYGVEITYIPQDAPLGLAHCVLIARDFLGDDDFVMYLGDNMLQQDLVEFVDAFEGSRDPQQALGEHDRKPPVAQILLAHVDDPTQFGVAALDTHGDIVELVEKPADPPSDLALVGVYLFDPTIHDAVRAIEPSARGELEITDAIQWLLNQGHRVRHEVLTGWWIDTGKKDPLLQCNFLVLDTHRAAGRRPPRRAFARRRARGRRGRRGVDQLRRTWPGDHRRRTRARRHLRRPVHVDRPGCELIDTEIEHSVVLDRSRIIGRAPHSRLAVRPRGRSGAIRRTPRATRLMLGDHSRADLE